MIATILKSSTHFSAVDYNERKVAKGTAELIEVQNFGYLQGTSDFNSPNIRQYLIDYSRRNQDIKLTQMHLAISCKGHEYSEEQLVGIAHQWLKEMGYADEGQPLLIYAHRDTNNTHIHIVTSRVNPKGKKISDHHERTRSQAVLNKIMGVDGKKDVNEAIDNALQYHLTTLGQFRAVLESSGYETYIDGDVLKVKKGGAVLDDITISEIERHFSKDDDEHSDSIKKRKKQLWAIMVKYRELSADKAELAAQLKKSFGISLVFHGKADSPYGYTIVDHKNRYVYKGSDIMNIKKLLDFSGNRRSPEDILKFIREQIIKDPNIDVVSLNRLLWHKYHAYISKNKDVRLGRQSFTLDNAMVKLLKVNNKLAYVQSFHPSSASERDLLCQFFRIEDKEKIKVGPSYVRSRNDEISYGKCVDNIQRIIHKSGREDIRQNLNIENIAIIRDGNSFYAVDMKNRHIVNMSREEIDTSLFLSSNHLGVGLKQSQSGNNQSTMQRATANLLRVNDTGHHANREWEIQSDGIDDYDDWRKLQR